MEKYFFVIPAPVNIVTVTTLVIAMPPSEHFLPQKNPLHYIEPKQIHEQYPKFPVFYDKV